MGNDPVNAVDPDGQNAITAIIKSTIRHRGNLIEVAIDVGGTIVTVVAPTSTSTQRIVALAELVAPVSPSDIKLAKDLLQRRLGGVFGGRKGRPDVRAFNSAIGTRIETMGGGRRTGGGPLPEVHFRGDGPGNKGGRFSDNSFSDSKGGLQVQTVDTNRDGKITERELAAARDIADRSKQPTVCVIKGVERSC